ncbi:MAG: sulfurtransferase-like selenium metabolism protein YedF [Lachnospiraceae bacterium]|nr:sulfurtransferase-like selenium metabolism protein YedF [Lachnospiraceae bacterium]
MANVIVNALGEQCPIPVVKATRALKDLKEAGIIEVHVDNEIAVSNLTKLANTWKVASSAEKKEEKHFVVTMTVEHPFPQEQIPVPHVSGGECPTCTPDRRKNTVVAIASDHMGHGNDELGKVLMKGFIYALSQLDELPQTIIFYNGGATITTEGSASIEDLKSMEAQGVEILTCGTCLDYYGLKEKLAVGSVTNMYTIVEKLNNADKIIKQ